MSTIRSIGLSIPPYTITQKDAMNFSRKIFSNAYKDIERLLKVFDNGQIKKRHFVKNIEWYSQSHSFSEKNQEYIEWAVKLGKEAIINCLTNSSFLLTPIHYSEIDAIFFISSTGIASPNIEARIMNELPFSKDTKRIPIWGLGCGGGASGLARAFEYCLAFPKSKVIVLGVELCSLTFQKGDLSKSNFIGTSLFADGVACALVCGNEANLTSKDGKTYPKIIDVRTSLLEKSLDVMGWNIKDEGLFVIFSKDIPTIIETWLKPTVLTFLEKHRLTLDQIENFVFHPGGKKVIDAYEKSFAITSEKMTIPRDVLRNFGNMSSATILYVFKQFMELEINAGSFGLACALGPGFSAELLLLEWK